MNHKIRLFMPILTVLILGGCSNQVQTVPAAGANSGSGSGANSGKNNQRGSGTNRVVNYSNRAGNAANRGRGGSITEGVNYGSGGGVSSTGTGRQYNRPYNNGHNRGSTTGQGYYQGGSNGRGNSGAGRGSSGSSNVGGGNTGRGNSSAGRGSSANGGSGAAAYRETYRASDLKNPKSLLSERVIYFDYDQVTIKPHYKKVLAAHAELLKRNPSISMHLEGHADERGTREYNVALSEQRAKSVQWYLRGKGITSSRTDTVAYGEERPLVVGDGEKSWAKNRRVELKYPGR